MHIVRKSLIGLFCINGLTLGGLGWIALASLFNIWSPALAPVLGLVFATINGLAILAIKEG